MYSQVNQSEPKSPLYVNNTNSDVSGDSRQEEKNGDTIIVAAEAVRVIDANNDPDNNQNKEGINSVNQVPLLLRSTPRRPQMWSCQHCNSVPCLTRSRTHPTKHTWIIGVIALLPAYVSLGAFWGIFAILVVLSSDCLKETEHFCGNCHEIVGVVPPFHDLCVKYSG